jgi:hypothetical protein
MTHHQIIITLKSLWWKTSTISILIVILLALCAHPLSADTETTSILVLPGSGKVGTELVVQINAFTANTGVVVTIDGKTDIVGIVTTDSDGDATCRFNLADHVAGTCEIWADDETYEEFAFFTVVPDITLSSMNGKANESISISGTGFTARRKVTFYFDSRPISSCDTGAYGSFSKDALTIPESSRGKHTIRVEDADNVYCESTYTIEQNATISPASGTAGTIITVNGTGFKANSDATIYFNDKDISGSPVGENGSFSATFTIPNCPTGIHKIKIDDGSNRYYADFSTEASMVLNPKEGNVGTQLSLKGDGFKAGTPTSITFDNIDIKTVTTDQVGSFDITFATPKSKHGEHTITVTDDTNTLEAKFTIESEPPVAPALISPPDESQITKTIELDWSDVMDSSGVTYDLEIAADGEFSEILVSEANLGKSEYSLPQDQAILPHREIPYFWRTRAIDSASNVGEWSEVRGFILGYNFSSIIANMPGWTKYMLIGLGFLLFAVLFIWLGSRRNARVVYDDGTGEEYPALERGDDFESIGELGYEERASLNTGKTQLLK